jgi:hypothetical protein
MLTKVAQCISIDQGKDVETKEGCSDLRIDLSTHARQCKPAIEVELLNILRAFHSVLGLAV